MKLSRIQFSLRTLLVVVTLLAVPCAYVAHEAQIVRKRSKLFKWFDDHEEWVMNFDDSDLTPIRRLLGDHSPQIIVYPSSATHEQVHRVIEAFPETKVIIPGSG